MKWIRLWVDEVVKGTTFDELNLAERGLWWSLLLLAGDSLNPGIVEIRREVAYTHETLASVVNCDRKILAKYIKKLISVGKIAQLKDGRLQIINWKKYQTRYEKYYKNNANNELTNANNGIKNGIRMPGRLEEEVDKKKIYKRKVPLPKDYKLTKEHIDYAESKGFYLHHNLVDIFEAFCIHHRKIGSKWTDWYAAWQTWIRKKIEFDKGSPIQKGIEYDGTAVEEIREELEKITPELRAKNKKWIKGLARGVTKRA